MRKFTHHTRNKKLKDSRGFSLIEAMVASLIVALAFVGIFTLTSTGMQSMDSSLMREKMHMIANQMMDVLETDTANIAQYDADFTTCNAPAPAEVEAWHTRRYEWCRRLNAELGAPVAGEVRALQVVDQGDGTWKVSVQLENRGGSVEVLVRRSFDG